jgi:hypothetical protein
VGGPANSVDQDQVVIDPVSSTQASTANIAVHRSLGSNIVDLTPATRRPTSITSTASYGDQQLVVTASGMSTTYFLPPAAGDGGRHRGNPEGARAPWPLSPASAEQCWKTRAPSDMDIAASLHNLVRPGSAWTSLSFGVINDIAEFMTTDIDRKNSTTSYSENIDGEALKIRLSAQLFPTMLLTMRDVRCFPLITASPAAA